MLPVSPTPSAAAVIQDKRKGLVSKTAIHVELRYGDGNVVGGVDTKSLKHLQPFR